MLWDVDRSLDRLCMFGARLAMASSAIFILPDRTGVARVSHSFGFDQDADQYDWAKPLQRALKAPVAFYGSIPDPSEALDDPFRLLSLVATNMLSVRVRLPGQAGFGALFLLGTRSKSAPGARLFGMLLDIGRLAEDILAWSRWTDDESLPSRLAEAGVPPLFNSPHPNVVAKPLADFILDTLVRRRQHQTYRGFDILTLRNWRTSVRGHQIAGVRALKASDPSLLAGPASEEMAKAALQTYGKGVIQYVVPVPCGHSQRHDCLSVQIASQVGQKLKIPVHECFEPRLRQGSSHPRRNASAPALTAKSFPNGRILLVDDVVTSGFHLLEAAQMLQTKDSHIYAMAWIGP